LDFGKDLMIISATARVVIFEDELSEKLLPHLKNDNIVQDNLCKAIIKKLVWKKHQQRCTEQKFVTWRPLVAFLYKIAEEVDLLFDTIQRNHASVQELRAGLHVKPDLPNPTFADKVKNGRKNDHKNESSKVITDKPDPAKSGVTCMLCGGNHFAFSNAFALTCEDTAKMAHKEGSPEYNEILSKFKESRKRIDDKRKENSAASKAKVK